MIKDWSPFSNLLLVILIGWSFGECFQNKMKDGSAYKLLIGAGAIGMVYRNSQNRRTNDG